MLFKGFSIFGSGGHFVQKSRTILAILVTVKLFQNPLTSLGGNVF